MAGASLLSEWLNRVSSRSTWKSGAKLLLFRDMTEYKKVLNAYRRPPCRNKYSLHAFG